MTEAPDAPAATPSAYRWVILGGVWLVYFCFGLTTASMAGGSVASWAVSVGGSTRVAASTINPWAKDKQAVIVWA